MGRLEEFRASGSEVPESKRKEFVSCMLKMLQASGMMTIKCVSLYDRELKLVRMVQIEDDRISATYNYFEDVEYKDPWTGYGDFEFDCECYEIMRVDDNGDGPFGRAVKAAIALMELYTEGVSELYENAFLGGFKIGERCVAWSMLYLDR